MNEKDFAELKQSVIEVGLMMRGELEPSREFIVKENRTKGNSSDIESWAICLTKDDDELIPMKIYKVVFHSRLKKCTVIDEAGETLVCPTDWFLPISFPSKVAKVLNVIETV